MNDAFKNIGYITVDEMNRAFNTECKPSDFAITDEMWERVKSIENKQAAISIPRRAGKSAAFKEIGRLTNGSELFIGPAGTGFDPLMRGASQRAKITTNKEEVNPMKDTRIEALERQVESLALRIQKLARWGDDTYKDGTVLIVDKVFQVEAFEAGDETVTAYRYVLVKIGAYWYMTGQNSGRSTWAQAIDFFNDGKVINIEKVTRTKAILTDVTE